MSTDRTAPKTAVLTLVAMLFLGGAALAQDEGALPTPEPTGQAPQAPPFKMDYGLSAGEYRFDLWNEYAPAGQLDGDGEAEISRVMAEFSAFYPMSARGRLYFELDAEYVNADFRHIDDLTPDGDLFKDLTKYSFSVTNLSPLTDRWSLVMRGAATVAGEAHAELDQSVTYRGVVGAAYMVNPNFQIGLSAAVATRLESDTVFIPFPMIEFRYQFNEQWRAEVVSFTGAKLVYSPRRDLDLTLRARWEYSEYRLDDDGPFEGGVLRETRFPVSVGLDWQFHPQWTLHGAAGFNAFHEWEIDDDNGNDLIETSVEGDLYLSAGLRFNF